MMKTMMRVAGALPLLLLCTDGMARSNYIHLVGTSPNYHHDESTNREGPSQCNYGPNRIAHPDCDGKRRCSGAGYCEGKAR